MPDVSIKSAAIFGKGLNRTQKMNGGVVYETGGFALLSPSAIVTFILPNALHTLQVTGLPGSVRLDPHQSLSCHRNDPWVVLSFSGQLVDECIQGLLDAGGTCDQAPTVLQPLLDILRSCVHAVPHG